MGRAARGSRRCASRRAAAGSKAPRWCRSPTRAWLPTSRCARPRASEPGASRRSRVEPGPRRSRAGCCRCAASRSSASSRRPAGPSCPSRSPSRPRKAVSPASGSGACSRSAAARPRCASRSKPRPGPCTPRRSCSRPPAAAISPSTRAASSTARARVTGSTAAPGGAVQLVTPIRIISNQGSQMGAFGRLSVRFLPEPGWLVLLAAGLAGLGLLELARSRS